MVDPLTKHLRTPVYKYLNGVESWQSASQDARIAFYGQMKGKAYGIELTRNAWDWFLTGWNGRSAPETSPEYIGPVKWLRSLGWEYCAERDSIVKLPEETGPKCPDCGVHLVPGARHFSGCKSHPGELAVKASGTRFCNQCGGELVPYAGCPKCDVPAQTQPGEPM